MKKIIDHIKYFIRFSQAKYYTKKLLVGFDINWFRGKRVAIIGGADSVMAAKLGEYIDEFDVVVRINKGVHVIEKQKEFVGTRTDFLFHSFMDNPTDMGSSPITPKLWEDYKVGRIIYGSSVFNTKQNKQGIYDILLFVRKTLGKVHFSEVKNTLYIKNLNAIFPFRPTHGFIAINTIFECSPKELYITGITFFKTPHNNEYRTNTTGSFKEIFTGKPGAHNPDAEYDYIKKLYEKHPEIIVPDKTLREIFKHN